MYQYVCTERPKKSRTTLTWMLLQHWQRPPKRKKCMHDLRKKSPCHMKVSTVFHLFQIHLRFQTMDPIEKRKADFRRSSKSWRIP